MCGFASLPQIYWLTTQQDSSFLSPLASAPESTLSFLFTPYSSLCLNRRDAKALQEKAAKKGAQAAAGGNNAGAGAGSKTKK
ncbi:hypothetical protein SCA6_014238 [Theobroma cacao]